MFSSCLPWFLKAVGECFQGDILNSLVYVSQLFNLDCWDSSTLYWLVFSTDSLDFQPISFGLRICLQELLSPSLSQVVCLPPVCVFLCQPGQWGALQSVLVFVGVFVNPRCFLSKSQCWWAARAGKWQNLLQVDWLRLLLCFFPMGNRFPSLYSNGS